jgi:hypothetical protein
MKKGLLLGGLLLVSLIGLAQALPPVIIGGGGGVVSECPVGCETASPKCCSSPKGSVYYGKL